MDKSIMDHQDFLKKQLDKKPTESKKFITGAIGGGAILVVWLVTLICLMTVKEMSAPLVNLATLVVTAIGAIFTTLVTGQSALDWKSTTALQNIAVSESQNQQITENRNITENINQHVIEEGSPGSPDVRPYSQHAFDE